MAFNPTKAVGGNAPAPAPRTAPSSQREAIEGALVEDPVEMARVDRGNPAQLSHAHSVGRVRALRMMNAVRTITPLLAHAMRIEADPKQQAAAFSKLLSRTSELAAATARKVGFDPADRGDRWAVNMLERGLAEVVAATPAVAGDIPQALSDALEVRATERPEIHAYTQDTAIKLALVQALAPVIAAQQEFDFFRRPEEDLAQVRLLLVDEVLVSMDALLHPMTPPSERQSAFAAMCQEAGQLMADAWRQESIKAREVVSRKSREEVRTWRQANPTGFPIDSVYTRFRQAMHRLRTLVKTASQ